MTDFASLDHLRARDAQDRVKSIEKESLPRYRSVIRNAALYVRQAGLLQALAFWLSKEGSERHVVEHLMTWLEKAETTKFVLQSRIEMIGPEGNIERPALQSVEYDPDAPHLFVEPLLERTSADIALLEAEAEAYLAWLARLVEGVHQSQEKKKANPGSESEAGGTAI